MAVLLYCTEEREGMIATSGERVNGESFPPRRYRHEGRFVVLDGNLPHVLDHDAREICKIAGYRLASPQECDVYYRAKRGETAVHESTPTEKDNQITPEESAPTPQVLTSENAPASGPRKSRKG